MNDKRILFASIFALFLVASCSSPNTPNDGENTEAKGLFEKYAQIISQKSDWLSFTIDHYINGEKVWACNASFCYKPDEQACCLYEETAPVKITHHGFYMYHPDDKNLYMLRHCEGEDTDSPYLSYKSTTENNRLTYLSALFMSPMKEMKSSHQLCFIGVSDTIIRGSSCHKLTALTPKSYWTSRQGDTVVEGVSQKLCHFYINKKNEMVDSLVTIEQLDSTTTIHHRSAVLKDICFEDKSDFFDSVFDFNADRFRDFTVYDEYMWSDPNNAKPSNTVTDELLDFPLVNLKNDSVFLKDMDGFVLLNLWSFSCPSCIDNLYCYKKQMDSLNYRILENEGIKIMAINYRSNNMDKISEIAQKTSTCDIMYSAKGMEKCIPIPYLGYYYLLSPQKEFIYKTYNLGDYSALLEAKANYERRHQNK